MCASSIRLGIIRTIAGGRFGQGGIDGPALDAGLGIPYELWAGADGSLLIGEVGIHRVLRVDPEGILRHVAGRPQGIIGAYSGDGGLAVNARLNSAEGVGMDREGKVFIADMRNSRIRLVDTAGVIITIAGTSQGSGGEQPADGTPAVLSSAGCPGGLAMGPDERPYYADIGPTQVRVLTVGPFRSATTTTTTIFPTTTTSSSTTTTTPVTLPSPP